MTFMADLFGGQPKPEPMKPPPLEAPPTVNVDELARKRLAKQARMNTRDSLLVETGGTGTGLSIPK